MMQFLDVSCASSVKMRASKVHGIGAVRAAEFVERGIRSLAHLREASAKNQVHLGV